MAKVIPEFDAGNLALHPTETGVESQAGAARRIGAFYNQQASATEMLARETERLGGETQQLGRETEQLGSEKGAAMAQAGRAIGGGIAEAGDAAVKYMDHQQISHGAASWATFLSNETANWDNTVKNADPNNPNVASTYMQGLETRLNEFQQNGFSTENSQKWAEAHVDALRQHFVEKTQADMSTLAGQAAIVNTQQTINKLSATVHGDPSSIDFALEGLKSSTEGLIGSSPNLRGTDVGKVRSEILQKGAESIVKSAAIGYIEKTATVPPWATDPKYSPYVNGAELQMLEKAAKVQARSDLLVQKQAQLYDKMVADQKVHAGSNKVISDNVTIDPQSGRPVIDPKFYQQTLDLARKNPDAPSASETVRAMLNWGESQQNKNQKPVDNPAVMKDLSERMFSADHPTSAIDLMKAHTAGQISDHTFTTMNGMVKQLEETPLRGPVWKDTMTAVHNTLNMVGQGSFSDLKDPIGDRNFANFVQTFVPQYLAKSRAGTLEPDALNLNNPNSFISKSLAPFRNRSMQSDLQSAAAEPAKPSAPEIPTSLRGIADLSRNKKTGQYRDNASGKIYDSAGNEVGR